MLDIVLCVLALVAGGFVLELFAVARAPRGYQDEHGFHFGIPVQQGPDACVLCAPTAKPLHAVAVPPVAAPLHSVTPA